MEDKLNKLDDHVITMNNLLINLTNTLQNTNEKINNMEKKINNMEKKIDGEVLQECKKMSGHIDFIEAVYDNVKHPLGFICKKIKYLINSTSTQYTLTNLEQDSIE